MEREEGRIIEPIEITPTTDPLGSEIRIRHHGLNYSYKTTEWNPKVAQTLAWNYLKNLILKEGGKG